MGGTYPTKFFKKKKKTGSKRLEMHFKPNLFFLFESVEKENLEIFLLFLTGSLINLIKIQALLFISTVPQECDHSDLSAE